LLLRLAILIELVVALPSLLLSPQLCFALPTNGCSFVVTLPGDSVTLGAFRRYDGFALHFGVIL